MLESILFKEKEFTDETKTSFKRDLNRLLEFNLKDIKYIIDNSYPIMSTLHIRKKQEVVRSIAEKLDQPEFIIKSCVNIINSFVYVICDDDYAGDTPKIWANDMVSLDFMPSSQKTKIIDSLTYLEKSLPDEIKTKIDSERFVRGVQNVYTGISHSVDFRASFSESYNLLEPIEEFNPKITGLTPLAHLQFSYSDYEDHEVTFQVEEDQLKRIIKYLKAVQKELTVLKEFNN